MGTREQIEHRIHEFQVAFEQEKQESLKREEQAQKRLQSSLSKMQERIDIHRGAMESRIKQLKEDIADANQRHESENMRFEEQVRHLYLRLYLHPSPQPPIHQFPCAAFVGLSRNQTGSRSHRVGG